MAIIKRNDTGQRLSSTLRLNGAAFNLAGRTVRFHMRNNAITSASAGTVQYAPTAEDVETEGEYSVEWEVTLDGDEKLTFPHNGYEKLTIIKDLA
jgi:hypothetical protein